MKEDIIKSHLKKKALSKLALSISLFIVLLTSTGYIFNSKGIIFVNIENKNQIKELIEKPFISFGPNKKSDYKISYLNSNLYFCKRTHCTEPHPMLPSEYTFNTPT